jgi:ketosteroid isomerase-like protein
MLFREERALLGALGWWAFDIAVLWACFHAFGEPPPVAVFVMAYFTGMLANLLPLPGGVGYVEGGMIAALLAFWVPGGLAGVAVLKARRWPDRRSRAPRSPAAGEPRAQRHGLDTATQRPLREHLERGRGRVRGRQAQLISDFYAARARRDWVAVRELLATDVIWHEAGDEDYSGDHRGRDAVTALLQQLVEVTDGSFRLEPLDFIATAEHVATNARWSAERRGTRVKGNDLPSIGSRTAGSPARGSSPTASTRTR